MIHLVDIGADPEVLINNTTYPIPAVSQTDGDISITLDKYQTEVNTVTDDEIQYIAYDKIRKVQEKHTKAVMSKKHSKDAHALAPAGNTVATPVMVTTGADDGGGRRKMLLKDILTHKRQYDNNKIPQANRVLVLCSDYYNDLLEDGLDKKVDMRQFSDDAGGLLTARLYGFKVYWYVDCPYFTEATLVKKAYGSVPVAGDYQASVSFYAPDMFKAKGLIKFYDEKPKPRTQQWEFNMRHNYIVLPRKARANGAIVSDAVA
ncbi:MAG: hypothetical protein PSN34_06310 [Urechidicola sp.]|nr:hypothetical protein [Urechidicola sp.]